MSFDAMGINYEAVIERFIHKRAMERRSLSASYHVSVFTGSGQTFEYNMELIRDGRCLV